MSDKEKDIIKTGNIGLDKLLKMIKDRGEVIRYYKDKLFLDCLKHRKELFESQKEIFELFVPVKSHPDFEDLSIEETIERCEHGIRSMDEAIEYLEEKFAENYTYEFFERNGKLIF